MEQAGKLEFMKQGLLSACVSCLLSRARLGHQPFSQLKAQIGGQHTLTIVQLSSNQGRHFLLLCCIIPQKTQSGLMAAKDETQFWADLLPGLPELPKKISDLPPELLCNIFNFLSFSDLKTALLVCRSVYQIYCTSQPTFATQVVEGGGGGAILVG